MEPTASDTEGRDVATDLALWLKRRAVLAGFDAAGIAWPSAVQNAANHLYSFLQNGFHGEMAWLAANADRRADPALIWPEVRSVFMLGMNYGSGVDPLSALAHRNRGAI